MQYGNNMCHMDGCFIEELKLDLLNKQINVFYDNNSTTSLIKGRVNSSKTTRKIIFYYKKNLVTNYNKLVILYFL